MPAREPGREPGLPADVEQLLRRTAARLDDTEVSLHEARTTYKAEAAIEGSRVADQRVSELKRSLVKVITPIVLVVAGMLATIAIIVARGTNSAAEQAQRAANDAKEALRTATCLNRAALKRAGAADLDRKGLEQFGRDEAAALAEKDRTRVVTDLQLAISRLQLVYANDDTMRAEIPPC